MKEGREEVGGVRAVAGTVVECSDGSLGTDRGGHEGAVRWVGARG